VAVPAGTVPTVVYLLLHRVGEDIDEQFVDVWIGVVEVHARSRLLPKWVVAAQLDAQHANAVEDHCLVDFIARARQFVHHLAASDTQLHRWGHGVIPCGD
jgi:hypothetical protein